MVEEIKTTIAPIQSHLNASNVSGQVAELVAVEQEKNIDHLETEFQRRNRSDMLWLHPCKHSEKGEPHFTLSGVIGGRRMKGNVYLADKLTKYGTPYYQVKPKYS